MVYIHKSNIILLLYSLNFLQPFQVEMILNQRLKELPPVVRPEALQMVAKKVGHRYNNNSLIKVVVTREQ